MLSKGIIMSGKLPVVYNINTSIRIYRSVLSCLLCTKCMVGTHYGLRRVCLSVRTYDSTREPLDGLGWNLVWRLRHWELPQNRRNFLTSWVYSFSRRTLLHRASTFTCCMGVKLCLSHWRITQRDKRNEVIRGWRKLHNEELDNFYSTKCFKDEQIKGGWDGRDM
jgi:hypothetical protein